MLALPVCVVCLWCVFSLLAHCALFNYVFTYVFVCIFRVAQRLLLAFLFLGAALFVCFSQLLLLFVMCSTRTAFIVFPLRRFFFCCFFHFELGSASRMDCAAEQCSPSLYLCLSRALARPSQVSSGGGNASGRMSHRSARPPVCDVNGNDSFRTGPTVQ